MKSHLYNIFHWYFTKKALPYWLVLAIDCAIIFFSGLVSYYIIFTGDVFASNFWSLCHSLVFSIVIFCIPFRIFHTYSGIIRLSSFNDLKRVGFAIISGSAIIAALSYFLPNWYSHGHFYMVPCIKGLGIMAIISMLLMWFERVAVKTAYDIYRVSDKTKPAFIYGVKEGGLALAKSIEAEEPQRFKLVGFVSPEGDLQTKYLMGVKVRRDGPNLIKHMKEVGATTILVSPLQAEKFSQRQDLINSLISENIKILMIPSDIEEWDGKSDIQANQLHEVEIEDLLPREKIEVDMDAIGKLLTGKRILITGAAGSIGSEMVRQVAVYKPSEMILIDQAETPMHDIRLLMARKFPHIKAQTIVTSISNKTHMEKIFSEHKPEYVFHAAAYKHVPMMEDNPGMAVQNNIYGTRVIADLAVKYGTKKFVMISTDKAVNPTNVMGCSKRICEIYCQSLNKAIVDGKVKGETQFVTTRFGNVLGSNGSVIPIFKDQIRRGGPVTVTDERIIRYFMLIPEACKLVLEAGTMGKGGEIFVFDMGKPVKIVDLAKRMIKLSGAKNIEIKFTGLRDGEKLFEEVLSDKENTKPTVHPKIMVASVREYDYDTAVANEERLLEASYSFDDMAIVKIMKEIVPEYKSQCSKYQALDK